MTGPKRLVFSTRQDSPIVASQRQRALEESLEGIATPGGPALKRRSWPKRVPLDGDSEAVDAYERYREWADDAGVSLSPAFERHRCECAFTATVEEQLRLPTACLAVYEAGELAAVYPHVDGDAVTVEDGIESLRSSAAAGPSRVAAGDD